MFEFIETPIFSKIVDRYLSDDDYAELQNYLNDNPNAGDVIRASGGVRKLRWASKNQGKRGGVRIIYYLKLANEQVWMLTLYSKNVKTTIPTHILKQIKEKIDNDR